MHNSNSNATGVGVYCLIFRSGGDGGWDDWGSDWGGGSSSQGQGGYQSSQTDAFASTAKSKTNNSGSKRVGTRKSDDWSWDNDGGWDSKDK